MTIKKGAEYIKKDNNSIWHIIQFFPDGDVLLSSIVEKDTITIHRDDIESMFVFCDKRKR